MTTFLLIRHGESLANVEGRFAGHLDAPLSTTGQAQAVITAEYIRSHYAVDAVYASDLARAFDTGKAVADQFGLPMNPDSDLREIFAGDWEGAVYDDLPKQFPASFHTWLTDIGNAVCDGGESVAHLQGRVLTALRRIAAEHDGQTVVIATHATPIRSLQCFCEGKPLDEMKTVPWVSNASVTVVECEQGALRLLEVGKDAHLGQQRTAFPKKI